MSIDYESIGEAIGKSQAAAVDKSVTIARGEIATVAESINSRVDELNDQTKESLVSLIDDLDSAIKQQMLERIDELADKISAGDASQSEELEKSLLSLRVEMAEIRLEMLKSFEELNSESSHDLTGLILEIGKAHKSESVAEIQHLTDRIRSCEVLAGQIVSRVEDIKDGEKGDQGDPGQDRPLIEPVDISSDKQYPKNTLGTYNGGLWIATKHAVGNPDSDPVGWTCLLDAMTTMSVQMQPDRTFKLSVRMATGKMVEDSFKMPFVEHKGIWEAGHYEQGQVVTKGHSFFQAMEDTDGEPPGNSWKQILTAPRGRKGEKGDSVEGPPGKPGRNGLDAKLPKNFIEDITAIASERKAFEDGRSGAEAITSFRGYFSPQETYRRGDVVNYDNCLYVVKTAGSYTSIGQSGGAFELMLGVPKVAFVPYMHWQGDWTQKTYNPGMVVRDGSWVMVATRSTGERAAPTAIGESTYTYNGTMSGFENTAKSVIYGQQFQNSETSVFLGGIKIDVVAGNRYRVFAVERLTNPIFHEIALFVAESTDTVEVATVNRLLPKGSAFRIVVLVTEPDPTPIQWTGSWDYDTPNNTSIPGTGVCSHSNSNPESLRFNVVDNNSGNRSAELGALTAGDKISVGSFSWIISAIQDNGTWFDFTVLPATQITPDGIKTFTFDTVTATPITIGRDIDYWLGNDSVSGLFVADGGYDDLVQDDNAYGIIDVLVQEAYVSPDWDIVVAGND